MEFRIPYYLFYHRNLTGKEYEDYEPTVSLPQKPNVNNEISYYYSVDTHGNDDHSDDELVITNSRMVPAGSNTTITVEYKIKPETVKDLDIGTLQAKGSCTSENETEPEKAETKEITYQLDTGIQSADLISRFGNSWGTSYVYSKPDCVNEDDWDTEKYHYFFVPFCYGTRNNQGANMTLTVDLGDGAEVVGHKYRYGKDNERSRSIESAGKEGEGKYVIKSYLGPAGWGISNEETVGLYVRYPASQDSSSNERKILAKVTAVAYDEDSHEKPGDLNDIISDSANTHFTWEPYKYTPGNNTFEKTFADKDVYYIENLKERGEASIRWHISRSYDGNTLPEGSTQKIEIYDDAIDLLGDKSIDEENIEYTGLYIGNFAVSQTNTENGKVTYPDIEEGDFVIEGYKDGKWEKITDFHIDAEKIERAHGWD